MLTHHTTHHTPADALLEGGFRYTSHGRAALATALDGGLMPDELSQILAGRRIVEAFPVWRGESPAAYAARAVSEMFVAYLQ
ncbi:hypothetical protein Q8W71_22010 [Methylobacterium sp. NEAU 140]|uniref:hypothetical protein n=1 Tax=Methylobacterium sp. NEAU 140 TaxID=3064945 RepID=UPI002734212F|nr:hypothetical protein [Methylobacterium sp. NEAU 140]MDP4025310.1 hypothetical protein [Methylobacterium sp. NEAU 140]